MIRQLSYLSLTQDGVTQGEVESLAARAEFSNRARGVTGMMAVGGGLLFQVLEGPRDVVEALFQRIRRDSRHRSVQVLTDEMLASRDFDGFPMAFRTLDEEAVETIAAAALVDETAIPEIVAAMSTPLLPQRPAGRPRLTLVHVAA